MLPLTFYGGVNEIGGNKILVEDGDTSFSLIFGVFFAERGEYFEEYLKPRGGAGLLDFLHWVFYLHYGAFIGMIYARKTSGVGSRKLFATVSLM